MHKDHCAWTQMASELVSSWAMCTMLGYIGTMYYTSSNFQKGTDGSFEISHNFPVDWTVCVPFALLIAHGRDVQNLCNARPQRHLSLNNKLMERYCDLTILIWIRRLVVTTSTVRLYCILVRIPVDRRVVRSVVLLSVRVRYRVLEY